MHIDSHQHFWRYDERRDSWITPQMSVLKRDFLPEDLLPELRANYMDGSVAVQADQSEQETMFLLDLAGRFSGITPGCGRRRNPPGLPVERPCPAMRRGSRFARASGKGAGRRREFS